MGLGASKSVTWPGGGGTKGTFDGSTVMVGGGCGCGGDRMEKWDHPHKRQFPAVTVK